MKQNRTVLLLSLPKLTKANHSQEDHRRSSHLCMIDTMLLEILLGAVRIANKAAAERIPRNPSYSRVGDTNSSSSSKLSNSIKKPFRK